MPGPQAEGHEVTDRQIIDTIKSHGIDAARLKACLDQKDNWGSMIHAFEYLTVLGVVCDAMMKDDVTQPTSPGTPTESTG